jgi:hypothetical protein
VFFAPSKKPWHGAAPTTDITHITVLEHLDGKTGEWLERVTDEQYRKQVCGAKNAARDREVVARQIGTAEDSSC